jgi:hypothetical protein
LEVLVYPPIFYSRPPPRIAGEKLAFVLLGIAAVMTLLLPAIAEHLTEEGALILGLSLGGIIPLSIAGATILSVWALFRRPRASLPYVAVLVSLIACVALAYCASSAFQNRVLEMRAEAGSLPAQYELGRRYARGADDRPGIYWLTRAAEGGHLAAQFELGDHYLTAGNFETARIWLQPLADSPVDGWEKLNARSRLESIQGSDRESK